MGLITLLFDVFALQARQPWLPPSPPPSPNPFFARPAELVAPELIGCLLVKRQGSGELLWAVIVEAETW